MEKNVKVKLNVTDRHFHHNVWRHETTQDFFQLRPVYVHEVVPGEDFKVKVSSFSRLSPLNKPLYANARQVMRAFFVPWRVLFPYANEYVEQLPYVDGSRTQRVWSWCPCTDYGALASVFTYENIGEIVEYFPVGESFSPTKPYDFVWKQPSNVDPELYDSWTYKFSDVGRLFYKVLLSLGLKVRFPHEEYDPVSKSTDNEYISLLPLLAYCRVWSDWFCNSNYSEHLTVESFFLKSPNENDSTSGDARYKGTYFDEQELATLAGRVCHMMYESDIFTDCWDKPFAGSDLVPNANLKDLSIHEFNSSDVSSSTRYARSQIVSDTQGVPAVTTEAGSTVLIPNKASYVAGFTQYLDSALHRISDLVQRARLVGTRVVDRYKADFGIELPAAKLNRSQYIGKVVSELQVSEVIANTMASVGDSQQVLGDYAGRGTLLQMDGSFDYKSDEYGFIIIVSYITVPLVNPYGTLRMWNHLDRYQHWHPSFDALGTSAIRSSELFDFNPDSSKFLLYDGRRPDDVFGFAPRYYEYKQHSDMVSGDFLNINTMESYRDWIMQRDLYHDFVGRGRAIDLKHDLQFTIADQNYCDIIFADFNTDIDHFVSNFFFDESYYNGVQPLWDNYEFDDSIYHRDRKFRLGGQHVTD